MLLIGDHEASNACLIRNETRRSPGVSRRANKIEGYSPVPHDPRAVSSSL
jgi:hypothetical protein